MNYATQNYTGNYQNTQTETATAIAPTVGRVRLLDAKTKGRKRSTERQTAIRTNNNATNGFLKCNFLPKLKTEQSVQACESMAKTERDFYKSLSRLAEHYNIEPMQTQKFEFPYNIVLGIWDLETKLSRTHTNFDSLELVQDSKKTYLQSEEKYDTGTTLYYIPVVPLYKMLKNPKRKKSAELLLSVCSYLYRIADIPYYREESSYLFWLYEMLNDWVENDDCMDDTENYKRELRQAECIGNLMEQKLLNRSNLRVFEQRLKQFKSQNPFDHECWRIAQNTFALYSEYPMASMFRNGQGYRQNPYEDDFENGTIGMEKYISFVADVKGWLYDNLVETINNEFNEYGAMEEPTICKRFDGTKITTNTLDFENRLFALLDDLGALLYDL